MLINKELVTNPGAIYEVQVISQTVSVDGEGNATIVSVTQTPLQDWQKTQEIGHLITRYGQAQAPESDISDQEKTEITDALTVLGVDVNSL